MGPRRDRAQQGQCGKTRIRGAGHCRILPRGRQGLVILGTPFGTDAFVQRALTARTDEHGRLLHSIPTAPDLQVVGLLLHTTRASARAAGDFNPADKLLAFLDDLYVIRWHQEERVRHSTL